MNPSPRRQAVVVGLFVAAGIAILIGGILTIGDLNETFTRKVVARAVFNEVSGLKEGDNIWFSGVKVGTVSKVELYGDASVLVELKVDREATTFVHADAIAKIGSDGLIGNRIVVLEGGTPKAGPLTTGTVLTTAQTVSPEAIMAKLQVNNENLLVITGRLARGEGTMGKLLTDETLYADLTETVGTLGEASDNAKALTGSLAGFSRKLNEPGTLPHDLVTDRTTYAQLTDAVGGLQHASEQAGDLVEGLALNASNPETPVGTLMTDEAAADDLKQTLENLETSSALLVEDLTAAQDSFLLRPYFKKKAKAEARAARKADR